VLDPADRPAEAVPSRLLDDDLHKPADQSPRPGEVDHAVVRGATGELVRVLLRGALDEHPLHRAHHRRVDGARLRVEQGLQAVQPGELVRRRRVVGELRGRRARPAAVDERVRGVESQVGDELQGLLEVDFRLAREADDEVRRDGDPRACGAQPPDDGLVLERRVTALHRREHAVRARLHRQVHVRRELGHARVGIDQPLRELLRVRGGVADALEAGNLRHVLEEQGEVGGFAVGHRPAVGVDVLPEQRHLLHAAVGEIGDLGQHVVERSRHFLAAGVGHDAEAAVLAAAFHDRHERARTRDARRRQRVELLDLGEGHVHLRAA
jgi:hypothetical protein